MNSGCWIGCTHMHVQTTDMLHACTSLICNKRKTIIASPIKHHASKYIVNKKYTPRIAICAHANRSTRGPLANSINSNSNVVETSARAHRLVKYDASGLSLALAEKPSRFLQPHIHDRRRSSCSSSFEAPHRPDADLFAPCLPYDVVPVPTGLDD